jgi:hypothetical protein
MFGTDGHNYLSLNGIEFNVDEFTAFDVAQVLRSESQLIQRFSSMGLPASVIQSMLNIAFPASTSGSETVKMDLRSKNEAVFLNNLEKDRQYKQWSSTVQELLTPGWPNQLKYVAKNLYQVLIVGRAADVMTLHMAAAAQYFVKNNAPFRVGLILTDSIETNSNTVVDKTNSDVWPEDVWPRASWSDLAPVKGVDSASTSTTSTSSTQSVSVDALLSKCFRYLAEVHSPISAFNFIDYFKSEHVAAKLTSQTVQSNFVSAFSRAPAKKASLYFLEVCFFNQRFLFCFCSFFIYIYFLHSFVYFFFSLF